MRATWKKSEAREDEWRLIVEGSDKETIYATIYKRSEDGGFNMYLPNQSIAMEGRFMNLETAIEEAEIKTLDHLGSTASAVRRLRHAKNKVE